MTLKDIAIVKEAIKIAKSGNLIEDALDFAYMLEKLLPKDNELIEFIIRAAGYNSQEKTSKDHFKSMREQDIDFRDSDIEIKLNTLEKKLKNFYLPKLLNDLPNEISESIEIQDIQDRLEAHRLNSIIEDEIEHSVYIWDFFLETNILDHFNEYDFECSREEAILSMVDYIKSTKNRIKELISSVNAYKEDMEAIEAKLERDENKKVLFYNDLAKYGLKFQDGYAVDSSGKMIAQAKAFKFKHYEFNQVTLFDEHGAMYFMDNELKEIFKAKNENDMLQTPYLKLIDEHGVMHFMDRNCNAVSKVENTNNIPQTQHLTPFDIAKHGGIMHFMSKDGCGFTVKNNEYDMPQIRSINIFTKGKKLGVKDSEGNITIEAKYDYIEKLNNEAIVAKKCDKYIVLDKNGKNIIPVKFELFKEIEQTKNFIVKSSDKYGVINSDLKFILELEFDAIKESNFEYNGDVIALIKQDKVEFVDQNLKPIRDRFFYIKTSNNAKFNYDYIVERYSFLDKDLNLIVQNDLDIYKQKGDFYVVRDQNENFGLMDNKGNILIDIKFKDIGFFEDKFYALNDKNIYIFDKNGEIIRNIGVDNLREAYIPDPFKHDLFFVSGDNFGLITSNLDVLEAKYDFIWSMQDFGYLTAIDDKRYLVSKNLKTIKEWEFDSFDIHDKDILIAQKDDNYYLLNSNGEILPQSYYFEIDRKWFALNLLK